MPPIIFYSVISICLALVFYTIAVWWNFRVKQLTKAHVALFCCGLVTDVAATSGMAASVQGKITWDFHTISGYTALVLMTLVTISGLYAIIKDHAGIRNNFHRASVPVWCVWMVSWITGVMLGLQKV